MAENVMKVSRNNTFRFEGTVNVTDKTFVINKTNEKGTWVQNRMGLSIDCGDDGYQFVTLNGGYNPTNDSIIYLSTVDENGNFLGRDHQLEIKFDERHNISKEDMERVNKNNLIRVKLDNEDEQFFITPYDAVDYLKDKIVDGMTLVVSGTIEESPSANGDDWYTNHVVTRITSKNKDLLKPAAVVDYTFLVDDNVVGQPNLEDMNVPLFFKGVTYVRKVGDKKYNQACVFPKKVLYEANDFNTDAGKKKFAFGVQNYFTPSKKGFVDELSIRCRYKSGAKMSSLKIEDLPQDIQNAITMGFMTEEQIMANAMAISGNRTTDLVFVRVNTSIKDVADAEGNSTPVIQAIRTPEKYKTSELVEFENLTPIEDNSEKAAPADNYEIADEEINETAQNILNMFASFNNGNA